MLNRELIGFIQEPVMMILAVQDAAGRPTIARGLGARVSAKADQVDIFVSRGQWPDLVEGCRTGVPLAATFCRPATYVTYQIKGVVLEASPVDGEDHAYAQRYMRLMRGELNGLGIACRQIDPWIVDRDLVRVRFSPTAAFTQTPGPDAGRVLAEA